MSADMIKVAVATDDGITSDVNFGRANRFVLAEISGGKIKREGLFCIKSLIGAFAIFNKS